MRGKYERRVSTKSKSGEKEWKVGVENTDDRQLARAPNTQHFSCHAYPKVV